MYGPGVLLELENIRAFHEQERPAWMDSCAVSIMRWCPVSWPDRRTIVSVAAGTGKAAGDLIVSALPMARWVSRLLRRKKRLVQVEIDHVLLGEPEVVRELVVQRARDLLAQLRLVAGEALEVALEQEDLAAASRRLPRRTTARCSAVPTNRPSSSGSSGGDSSVRMPPERKVVDDDRHLAEPAAELVGKDLSRRG